MRNNSCNYTDILEQDRPISKRHPRMANADRAKQFSPFAALKGYEEALQLKQKRAVLRIELSEDAKIFLDHKLHILNKWLKDGHKPVATIRYFVPKAADGTGKTTDEKGEELGSYLEISGEVEKINAETRVLQIAGEVLFIDDVVDIQEDPVNDTSEQTIHLFGDACV